MGMRDWDEHKKAPDRRKTLIMWISPSRSSKFGDLASKFRILKRYSSQVKMCVWRSDGKKGERSGAICAVCGPGLASMRPMSLKMAALDLQLPASSCLQRATATANTKAKHLRWAALGISDAVETNRFRSHAWLETDASGFSSRVVPTNPARMATLYLARACAADKMGAGTCRLAAISHPLNALQSSAR
jgi:hypothetical protein